MKTLTIEYVKRTIYKYGYLPMIYYLKHLELVEDYRAANIVLNALKDTCKIIKECLPTQTNKQTLKALYSDILKEFKKDSSIYENNLPYYIDQCKKEMEKFRVG